LVLDQQYRTGSIIGFVEHRRFVARIVPVWDRIMPARRKRVNQPDVPPGGSRKAAAQRGNSCFSMTFSSDAMRKGNASVLGMKYWGAEHDSGMRWTETCTRRFHP
jgi:hypothetical protein